ncbi:unnamed protein product [Caenorhabditis sp. 36 PRJEB53466]|nr:unnamed protein product [Caenorhabditis sp. 36 PRJEB53466]
MLVASLALISVGFWMRYDNSFDTDLKSVVYKYDDPKNLADAKFTIRVWLIVVYWSITGLAIGAFVTAIFGFLSFFAKTRWILIVYLVLMIVLIVLEIGSGVGLLCYRNNLRNSIHTLISAMYTSNSVADLAIIQSKYSCCGTQDGAFNLMYCQMVNEPYCDVAVFNSVDNTMMLSGIVFLVVLILQLIAVVLPVPVLLGTSGSSKNRFESTQIDRF